MTAPLDDDQEDRNQIRSRLDVSVVVEAAAGTGKTTEMVRRMVAVLQSGVTTVDRLVAVTFTEKAAGELKLRLRTELENARKEHPSLTALEEALAHLEEAHVNTIHGFCAELLRSRPVEARVDPLFRVLTEPESKAVYAQAFGHWLHTELDEPHPGVRRALQKAPEYLWGADRVMTPRERLEQAGWLLAEWRDHPAPWTLPKWNRPATVALGVARLKTLANLLGTEPKSDPWTRFRNRCQPVIRMAQQLTATGEDGAEPQHVDAVEASLLRLNRTLKWVDPPRNSLYAPGVKPQDVTEALARLKEALGNLALNAEAELAALLQQELQVPLADYEELKARTGVLDFMDLLLRTRELLRHSAEARRSLQERFTHIFVDEFQDTDLTQAEILLLLAADDATQADWQNTRPVAGKLFLVGDPKQSIYRFRHADVGVYFNVRDRLVANGAVLLKLARSFRAVPNLQAMVNASMAPLMTGDPERQQAAYVPLLPSRDSLGTQPSVVVLAAPRPYGMWKVSKKAAEQFLPQTVGAFVHWLVHQSGWKVTARAGAEPEPVKPEHICLLTRRLVSGSGDITRPYVAELEARGIPHLLVGGRSFHTREEVEMMRVALGAVERPDDALRVYATLHGPLFGIPDDVLLRCRVAWKTLHPLEAEPRAAATGEEKTVADALLLLAELHRERNKQPAGATVHALLTRTRAHAGLVLRHGGEQALANVLHVAELARQHERSGGHSFRGFVERLEDEAERGAAPEAPVLEEGSGGVRIMSVHRAKGLEFPVVVLVDMASVLASDDPSRRVQGEMCAQRLMDATPLDLREAADTERAREMAEAERLAYVAATRARDLLVIPGVGDGPPHPHWLTPLDAGIYPPVEARRHPSTAEGCPPFGEDTVLARPDERSWRPDTVKPGLHDMGTHQVVWWDPATLELEVETGGGLRREELIAQPADPARVAQDLAAHTAWLQALDALRNRAATPSLSVQTVTERAETDTETVLVDVVSAREQVPAARGARYGTLVHAVLATAALDADPSAVDAAAALQARVLGASHLERQAAAAAVVRALAHPLLEQARTARSIRREAPVTWRSDAGELVEGVADLLFESDAGWTVVDFKTTADPTAREDAHARQVELYARAVRAATGKQCRPVVLHL